MESSSGKTVFSGTAVEAWTKVTQTAPGEWTVEVGMGHVPYQCSMHYQERPSGDQVELVCDSITLSGGVVRATWLRDMADDLERFEYHARAAIAALRPAGGGELRRAPRRHRELTDEFLAEIVRRRAEHEAAGRPPTATLATEEGVSTGAVKNWLRKAREAGIEAG